jgi:spore maturation protein CgeB
MSTGVGAMLLTDRKENLQELFDVGKEVLAYSNKEEALEFVRYYLDHPSESEEIAKAGQARTLRDHTYSQRMQELVPMLKKYLYQ